MDFPTIFVNIFFLLEAEHMLYNVCQVLLTFVCKSSKRQLTSFNTYNPCAFTNLFVCFFSRNCSGAGATLFRSWATYLNRSIILTPEVAHLIFPRILCGNGLFLKTRVFLFP